MHDHVLLLSGRCSAMICLTCVPSVHLLLGNLRNVLDVVDLKN